ncbi:MAG: septum formation family protein [Gulosibacter sp.]|uniref:septum formation family protein n=1 Tax=Gulosibacter sp. TaxID=2817531 RepID=UPI003F91F3A9
MKTTRLSTCILACIVASGALLSGCAVQDEENEPISIFETGAGDCFTADEGNAFAYVVSCSEPHLYEVTTVVAVDGDSFPGDEAIQQLIDENCPQAFADFTGEAPATSTDWSSMAFAPSEGGWNEQGDRNIVCVVTPSNGEAASESAEGVTSEDPTPEGTP